MRKLTDKLDKCKRFVSFVIKHFIEDDCIYRASALAFTTLLAIVPLVTVGFAVLSVFPVFQNWAPPVQDFIFSNFVPATGKIIQNYLQLLIGQISTLSIMGVVFLFTITLLVMHTVESTMNKIWHVRTPRHGLSAFILYWAIVSLTPFLLGLSLAASSYILSLPFVANHNIPSLLNYLPFLFSLLGFTFLYVVVPNCPVLFRYGLYGGIIAALLFESAKLTFAYYLTHYNTYQSIYGAFAAVPIFFVWIYWVWFISLLGAEISYAFSMHHQRRKGQPLDGFSHALLWLYRLRLAQINGQELSIEELINVSQQAYAINVNSMLQQFIELKLIKKTSSGHYLLSRDLNYLSLYELTQLLPYRLPNTAQLAHYDMVIRDEWQAPLITADEQLKKTLQTSLSQLFDPKL